MVDGIGTKSWMGALETTRSEKLVCDVVQKSIYCVEIEVHAHLSTCVPLPPPAVGSPRMYATSRRSGDVV